MFFLPLGDTGLSEARETRQVARQAYAEGQGYIGAPRAMP